MESRQRNEEARASFLPQQSRPQEHPHRHHEPEASQRFLPQQQQEKPQRNRRREHQACFQLVPTKQPQEKSPPTKQLTQMERDYWQQRLPHGFQFYLERLARGVIRNQPVKILEFSFLYLEELLVARNAELWKLPVNSYFTKLYKKKFGATPWQPRRIHMSLEREELLPRCADTLPDIVATENLPDSTLSAGGTFESASSGDRGSALIRGQDDAFESPEMLTASDCLCNQKESDVFDNQSSQDGAHHTTAASATFDLSSGGSTNSLNITEETHPSGILPSVNGRDLPVWTYHTKCHFLMASTDIQDSFTIQNEITDKEITEEEMIETTTNKEAEEIKVKLEKNAQMMLQLKEQTCGIEDDQLKIQIYKDSKLYDLIQEEAIKTMGAVASLACDIHEGRRLACDCLGQILVKTEKDIIEPKTIDLYCSNISHFESAVDKNVDTVTIWTVNNPKEMKQLENMTNANLQQKIVTCSSCEKDTCDCITVSMNPHSASKSQTLGINQLESDSKDSGHCMFAEKDGTSVDCGMSICSLDELHNTEQQTKNSNEDVLKSKNENSQTRYSTIDGIDQAHVKDVFNNKRNTLCLKLLAKQEFDPIDVLHAEKQTIDSVDALDTEMRKIDLINVIRTEKQEICPTTALDNEKLEIGSTDNLEIGSADVNAGKQETDTADALNVRKQEIGSADVNAGKQETDTADALNVRKQEIGSADALNTEKHEQDNINDLQSPKNSQINNHVLSHDEETSDVDDDEVYMKSEEIECSLDQSMDYMEYERIEQTTGFLNKLSGQSDVRDLCFQHDLGSHEIMSQKRTGLADTCLLVNSPTFVSEVRVESTKINTQQSLMCYLATVDYPDQRCVAELCHTAQELDVQNAVEVEKIATATKQSLTAGGQTSIAQSCLEKTSPIASALNSRLSPRVIISDLANISNHENKFSTRPKRRKINRDDREAGVVLDKVADLPDFFPCTRVLTTTNAQIAENYENESSETSKEDDDSDTCGLISEIQNEERSLKTDPSLRKCNQAASSATPAVGECLEQDCMNVHESLGKGITQELVDVKIMDDNEVMAGSEALKLQLEQQEHISRATDISRQSHVAEDEHKEEQRLYDRIQISPVIFEENNHLSKVENDHNLRDRETRERSSFSHAAENHVAEDVADVVKATDNINNMYTENCKHHYYEIMKPITIATIFGDVRVKTNTSVVRATDSHESTCVDGEKKQACNHTVGASKVKMQRALGIAKNYISELEKVTLEIETILASHRVEKTDGDNVVVTESSVKSFIRSAPDLSEDLAAEKVKPFSAGNNIERTASLKESNRLTVSASFLDLVSKKIVDICSGNDDASFVEGDSSKGCLEYRTGNIIFKIKRTQSSSTISSPPYAKTDHEDDAISVSNSILFDDSAKLMSSSRASHTNNNGDLLDELAHGGTQASMAPADLADPESLSNSNMLNHTYNMNTDCSNNNHNNSNGEYNNSTDIINVTTNIIICCVSSTVNKINLDMLKSPAVDPSMVSQFNELKVSQSAIKCPESRITQLMKGTEIVSINRDLGLLPPNRSRNTNNNGNKVSYSPRNLTLVLEPQTGTISKSSECTESRKQQLRAASYGKVAKSDIVVVDGNTVYSLTGNIAISGDGQGTTSDTGDLSTKVPVKQLLEEQSQSMQSNVKQDTVVFAATTLSDNVEPGSIGQVQEVDSCIEKRNEKSEVNLREKMKRVSLIARSCDVNVKPNKETAGVRRNPTEKPCETKVRQPSVPYVKKPKFSEWPWCSMQKLSEKQLDDKTQPSEERNLANERRRERQLVEKIQLDESPRCAKRGSSECSRVRTIQRNEELLCVRRGSSEGPPVRRINQNEKPFGHKVRSKPPQNGKSKTKDRGICRFNRTFQKCYSFQNEKDKEDQKNASTADHIKNIRISEYPNDAYIEDRSKGTQTEEHTNYVNTCDQGKEINTENHGKKANTDNLSTDTNKEEPRKNATTGDSNNDAKAKAPSTVTNTEDPSKDTNTEDPSKDPKNEEQSKDSKVKRSPLCYFHTRKQELWEQERQRKSLKSKNAACMSKQVCPKNEDLEGSQMRDQETGKVTQENMTFLAGIKNFSQSIKNRFLQFEIGMYSKQDILGLKLPAINIDSPASTWHTNKLVSKPNIKYPRKLDFPMRIRAISNSTDKEQECVPAMTRRLTVESPEENVLFHTSFYRPNPKQKTPNNNLEVTSQQRRLYLEEDDNFINVHATRRLICETECFSSKDPKTQNLVIENGTSGGMHATVKVVTGNIKKRKANLAKNSHELVKSAEVNENVADSVWNKSSLYTKNYVTQIGNLVIIGKPSATSALHTLIENQESKDMTFRDIHNKSSNASLLPRVGNVLQLSTHYKLPVADRVKGHERGDNFMIDTIFINVNNNMAYDITPIMANLEIAQEETDKLTQTYIKLFALPTETPANLFHIAVSSFSSQKVMSNLCLAAQHVYRFFLVNRRDLCKTVSFHNLADSDDNITGRVQLFLLLLSVDDGFYITMFPHNINKYNKNWLQEYSGFQNTSTAVDLAPYFNDKKSKSFLEQIGIYSSTEVISHMLSSACFHSGQIGDLSEGQTSLHKHAIISDISLLIGDQTVKSPKCEIYNTVIENSSILIKESVPRCIVCDDIRGLKSGMLQQTQMVSMGVQSGEISQFGELRTMTNTFLTSVHDDCEISVM